MSIPKKGARKIQVDAISYRWFIRRKYVSADDQLVVVIEKEEDGECVLYVITGFLRPDGAFEKIGTSTQGIVTPKDVETYIKTAIAKGWQPETKGSAFELRI
ncbi:hypothetical protein [uncultured Dokdonia sp.]|uniref:hypothetical protein n=1 Tax=uncultured Dokdonia sp. TaxID=575653 RepID=UPI0026039B3C|nr:hypothetical protein [uncultured Dokdonia sp.]